MLLFFLNIYVSFSKWRYCIPGLFLTYISVSDLAEDISDLYSIGYPLKPGQTEAILVKVGILE